MRNIAERLKYAGTLHCGSEPMQNQLGDTGEAIEFEFKEVHKRLEALEQKPPPEPARDKDGKPEGGLKFPDFVYNTCLKMYGVFIEPHPTKLWANRVCDEDGCICWEKQNTLFKSRPEKQDC